MRYNPDKRFVYYPCSYVGVATAFEYLNKGSLFCEPLPEGLKDDGYLTLERANRFVRQFLPVLRKVYYKRAERVSLQQFLKSNLSFCCVCVLGHFIFVAGKDYWSFFDNLDDKLVCVWYLKS